MDIEKETPKTTDVVAALDLVSQFKGSSLATVISDFELAATSRRRADLASMLSDRCVCPDLLRAAIAVKRAAAQIDVIVHAVGTLMCLIEILEEDEFVESLSLGAGNAGRKFNVETNKRVADITFIEWKGGSEAIRKQKLFKDFYELAECDTSKRRCLYFVGNEHATKVFSSRSPCKGMLRKFAALQADFIRKYGSAMPVREYYSLKKHLVELADVNSVAPITSEALD
jgi:hypothetical protein